MEAINNRRLGVRLGGILCLLFVGSCTSHERGPSATCREEALENLDLCRSSAEALTPFLENLCNEEFEEQLQACAP